MDHPQSPARRALLRGLLLGGVAGGTVRPGRADAAPSTVEPFVGGPPNTAVIWGDSITAEYDGSNGTDSFYSAQGYWTWAEILSRRRVRLSNNAGVGGQTTREVLARFDTDVGPYAPGWVVIECGTNDMFLSLPFAETTGNLAMMLDRVRGIGADAILCTVPPRDDTAPATKAVQAQVNRWIRDQAVGRRDVAVADFYQALVDPRTGGMLPTLSDDGVHPNGNGAYRCGKVVADILDQQTPLLDVLGHSPSDPLLLSTNPYLVGDLGSTGNGVTGEVADGWTVAAPPWTGVTARATKVARDDGLPGEWQQVTVSSGVGARLYQNQDGANLSWNPGATQVYAVCEFETDGDWADVTEFHLDVVAMNSWQKEQGSVTNPKWLGETWLAESRPGSGVLGTPVMTVPASADKRLVAQVFFSGVGTIRVGRFALYKVA